jgi:hypothetical protein
MYVIFRNADAKNLEQIWIMASRISLSHYLVSIFIAVTSISCVKNETPENCFGDIIKDTTNSLWVGYINIS